LLATANPRSWAHRAHYHSSLVQGRYCAHENVRGRLHTAHLHNLEIDGGIDADEWVDIGRDYLATQPERAHTVRADQTPVLGIRAPQTGAPAGAHARRTGLRLNSPVELARTAAKKADIGTPHVQTPEVK